MAFTLDAHKEFISFQNPDQPRGLRTYVEVGQRDVGKINFSEVFPDPKKIPETFRFVQGRRLEGQVVNLCHPSSSYRVVDRIVPLGHVQAMLIHLSSPVSGSSVTVGRLAEKFSRHAGHKSWEKARRMFEEAIAAAQARYVPFLGLQQGQFVVPNADEEIMVTRQDLGIPAAGKPLEIEAMMTQLEQELRKDPLMSSMMDTSGKLGSVSLEDRIQRTSIFETQCKMRTMFIPSLERLSEILDTSERIELYPGELAARLAYFHETEFLDVAERDPRIDFNALDINGVPAIGGAVLSGRLDNLHWFLSGRADLSMRDETNRHFIVPLLISAAVGEDFTKGQRIQAVDVLLSHLDRSCIETPDDVHSLGILAAAPNGMPYIELLERHGFMDAGALLDASGANMALRALRAGAIDNFIGLAQREGMVTFANRAAFTDALNKQSEVLSPPRITAAEKALHAADMRIMERAIKTIHTGGDRALPLPRMKRP